MLNGKIALITGGDKGIGKAISLKYSENNAGVVFTYCRDEAAAKITKEEITRNGGQAEYFQLDLHSEESLSSFIQGYLERIGRIDILVNNAASLYDTLFAKADMSKWWDSFDIIFRGSVNLTKGLLNALMMSDNGRIINIASVAGIVGIAGQSNYSCAKSALIMFSKVLGKELARLGVTVNAVAPGYIETEMTAGFPEERRKQFKQSIPMNRFGKPEEIAGIALFLASSLSSYITGQVIACDGGMT